MAIKGETVAVFTNQQQDALSDVAVDCREVNAAIVQVIVTGTTPSATVAVQGGPAPGGPFVGLADQQSRQTPVTSSVSFDCLVGLPFVKVRLSSLSGSFGPGEGFTVKVTPYVGPGGGRLAIRMG